MEARIDQFFPYETVDTRGTILLPEDLGYHAPQDAGAAYRGGSADRLLAAADAEPAVRDGLASFFFHRYEDPAAQDRLATGIQARGYRFVLSAEVLVDAPDHLRPRAPRSQAPSKRASAPAPEPAAPAGPERPIQSR
jgi:hypothetical protein